MTQAPSQDTNQASYLSSHHTPVTARPMQIQQRYFQQNQSEGIPSLLQIIASQDQQLEKLQAQQIPFHQNQSTIIPSLLQVILKQDQELEKLSAPAHCRIPEILNLIELRHRATCETLLKPNNY